MGTRSEALMDTGELLNEKVSKKMGLGMVGMYTISQCDDLKKAIAVAVLAVVGIVAQAVIDWRKAKIQ
jgi:hypothetical protein